MTDNETIICKPTSWFLWRAVLMLAMFGGFSAWFAYDGMVGYREKNLGFVMNEIFKEAGDTFEEQSRDAELTAEAWTEYVSQQMADMPEDPDKVLPEGTPPEIAWPEILKDYQTMKDSGYLPLWEKYTGEREMDAEGIPKAIHDAGSIQTQKTLSAVCAALALITLFFLIRTMGRKMVGHAETVDLPGAGEFRYDSIYRLDKRKWDTKGLAVAHFKAEDGSEKRGRIDGLTYGGFKKEEGELAEKLILRIQANMSGEVLEYAADIDDEDSDTSESSEASGTEESEK